MLKYDADGSEIHLENGKIISRQMTTYNSDGKFLEWISYENDGAIREIRTWQFNKNNLITKWSYLNPDRSVKYIETSTYDDFGNRLEHVGRDQRVVYEYNAGNKPVVHRRYDKDGLLMLEQLFTYDELGNMILEQFIGKEVTYIYQHIYDNNNVEIEINIPWNYKTICKYDAGKRLINEISYNGSGTMLTNCFYEYDEYGECIGERYEDVT